MQVDFPRPPARLWLAMLTCFGCAACSGKDGLHPVEGKVLYKDQPAKGVMITFHPKGKNPVTAVRPAAETQADGTFKLVSGQQEGAAAGEYVVTFFWPEVVESKAKKVGLGTDDVVTRDRLMGRYAAPARSEIKVTIKPGLNTLDPFLLK